jgi:bifunctional non-homologous end joining protein LigD
VSYPLAWDELEGAAPGDFTLHTAAGLLGARDPWVELMPPPQLLSEALVEEGRRIPIARVQAMHEGKRRARARRQSAPAGNGDGDGDAADPRVGA